MDILSFTFYLFLLGVHIILYTIAGSWLVINHKQQHDKSRLLLGGFLLGLAISCCTFVLTYIIRTPEQDFAHSMIEPYPCILSFPFWVLAPFYIMDVIRPSIFTRRHIILMLCPWIAVSLCFLIWHASTGFAPLTHITNLDDLINNWPRTEIILRCAVGTIFIPYGLMVFAAPDSWKKISAPQPWTRILTGLVALSTLSFTGGMLLRIPWIMIAHVCVFDTIALIGFILETKIRIPVPEQIANETVPSVPAAPAKQKLIHALETMMASGAWQNPDLDRENICTLLGTNRTYLTNAVQQLGYSSFSDMVTHYRVVYIHDTLEATPTSDILEVIFQAGYRNRTTANRAFAKQYGCIISVYQKSLLETE